MRMSSESTVSIQVSHGYLLALNLLLFLPHHHFMNIEQGIHEEDWGCWGVHWPPSCSCSYCTVIKLFKWLDIGHMTRNYWGTLTEASLDDETLEIIMIKSLEFWWNEVSCIDLTLLQECLLKIRTVAVPLLVTFISLLRNVEPDSCASFRFLSAVTH